MVLPETEAGRVCSNLFFHTRVCYWALLHTLLIPNTNVLSTKGETCQSLGNGAKQGWTEEGLLLLHSQGIYTSTGGHKAEELHCIARTWHILQRRKE